MKIPEDDFRWVQDVSSGCVGNGGLVLSGCFGLRDVSSIVDCCIVACCLWGIFSMLNGLRCLVGGYLSPFAGEGVSVACGVGSVELSCVLVITIPLHSIAPGIGR